MDGGDVIHPEWERLVEPHVASFDYFLNEGLEALVRGMDKLEIEHPVTKVVHRFWFSDPRVDKPVRDDLAGAATTTRGADFRLMPRDCREAGTSYKGQLSMRFHYQAGDAPPMHIDKRLGGLPIMVRSSRCHLAGLGPAGLVAAREEAHEMGGYFICNGIERIIRMLVVQRRHYIMGLKRGAYRKRGSNYTEYATLIRCVQPDQTSATVRCHYLTDGTVNFAFTMRRAEYFIPLGVLLKCFLEVSDRELYDKLLAGAPADSGQSAFVAERAELLLRQAAKAGLQTRSQCLEHLGKHFRIVLGVPNRVSDYEAGLELLHRYVFIHLSEPLDKLQLALAMLAKLYSLVSAGCCDDNADALTHHEVLLPGHLLCKFVKERLGDCLDAFKEQVSKDLAAKPEATLLEDEAYVRKAADRMPDVGRKAEYLLNTGNLVSKSGLDLSQATGFTVVAEKLNFFRYLSHFRSVHRGAYFAELRTTAVRKLLPESWGFMCPVHTPDGSPCGLLNHLTAACRVMTHEPQEPAETEAALIQTLLALGMLPASPAVTPPALPSHLQVLADGKVLGWVRADGAHHLVDRLRTVKAAALAVQAGHDPHVPTSSSEDRLPPDMEVAHLPYEQGGPFPGIYIFTQASRMVRPTLQLRSGLQELVGSLEQSAMSIRCPDGGHGGSPGVAFTHSELSAGAMLSVVASMTPYSDFNQSPRNMYQCQMAKQTMGTAAQAIQHRTDGKMYRLHTPQTPIARTAKYDQYHMDEFPAGTNAVVAVLAYTGFDMEDAMILNKSSMERGLAHGTLYKTETIDLRQDKGSRSVFAPAPKGPRDSGQPVPRPVGAFGQRYPQNVPVTKDAAAVSELGLDPLGPQADAEELGLDGLPHVGAIVWPGRPLYSTQDAVTTKHKAHKLKGEEVAVIDQITLVGTKEKGGSLRQVANVKMRINRNPVIGDKFSSRHGQKGVLSVLWPDEDMPFCAATGIRPDLLINPHAFPSRMTIGMLVESLVAKGGALKGEFVDATPFQRSEGKTGHPAESWGQYLESQGFAKYGQETMVSGSTGQEMPCDIYIGLVYYQRLRHMVSDKFQVRSTGPINALTRQPIKGRKFGGGIRFGEMERDSLLAHGAAYLLHDRLHACSDYHVLDVCTQCGSVLAPFMKRHAGSQATQRQPDSRASAASLGRVVCPQCDNSGKHLERVAMPYVFKFLATELAAMNIKLAVEVG